MNETLNEIFRVQKRYLVLLPFSKLKKINITERNKLPNEKKTKARPYKINKTAYFWNLKSSFQIQTINSTHDTKK